MRISRDIAINIARFYDFRKFIQKLGLICFKQCS
ncbi:hypothetical protein T02_1732 [Trichinella nativa]|uniref:Uncharacterized protein n=1 Tax=Trichinella nativa TaxID=6335 RepID=A0A0V1KMW0_9BILA|nr:hypothetical protein T06_14513 [Trichinella sp. T6]KRZ48438.1 hypothetical protein T02_1732 [Trichinella nativa]